jgi:hypothetical protein
LKYKIVTASILTLSNIQQHFEIETNVSGYTMGTVLMQRMKSIYFHSKTIYKAMMDYPTYAKELYALVQSLKKWKHYLMDKETIIHTYHQSFQYLQSQIKLQKSHHFQWMRFLQ